ncbi:MAG: hypothetical protein B6U69_03265 [Thermofilum sp. ex4484_15]|nr:MAG: hypothetical protein B6U69_03265 [Thermofilum sp. ex4484_15]
MKVVVGSLNPVKIEAVKEAFGRIFGRVEVVGVRVDSGVPRQPFGEEVKRGALNRALRALNKVPSSDYGVGIEGGIVKLWGKYYNFGFVAIVSKDGRLGTGTSGLFECPSRILRELMKGKELGEVMDEIVGTKGTKFKEGAIGFFTRKALLRKDLYIHGVLMALVPLINEEFFKDSKRK